MRTGDKTYSCNPHKYSVFFRDAADKFPELFEDVFIEKDPFLPLLGGHRAAGVQFCH